MSTWTLKPKRIAATLVLTTIALLLVIRIGYLPYTADLNFHTGGTPPADQTPPPADKESDASKKPPKEEPKEQPKLNFELFGLKDLVPGLEVATINITASYTDEPIPTLQKLPIKLPKFAKLQLDSPRFDKANPIPTGYFDAKSSEATVSVARPAAHRDASHIVIGAATRLERLPDALRGFKHWAGNTGARFIVSVEPHSGKKDEPTIPEAIAMYEKEGVNLTLIESKADYIDRYVTLIGLLNDHMDAKTEWASIIDDDTFFFDMATLLHMLDKYPSNESYWVGALSENKFNVNVGGITPVGGAGFFMSRKLMDQLAPHSDECVKLPNQYGDGRVSDCVLKFTTTKLSLEYGMFQLDIFGDVTGFYEAVRPQPITVHHWKTWHHHDMPTVAAVADVCGRACVLQNFEFLDGWRMSNGFSVVKYGYGRSELNKQIEAAMEHTWKPTEWDIPNSWMYSFEPLKPKDEHKIQYMMERFDKDPVTGAMTLYYVKRKDGKGESVIRAVWTKAT